MMIGRQRERITSGLTTMIREHNRSSSAAPSSAAPSSSSSIGAANKSIDRLLGTRSPCAAASPSASWELQEDEIWGAFEDPVHVDDADQRPLFRKWRSSHARKPSDAGMSAPMNVPDWSQILKSKASALPSYVDDADDDYSSSLDGEKENWVPPHTMVDRAHFSVLEGAGRTLKGWDLRRMRNRVWEQTGFLCSDTNNVRS